MFAFPRTIFVDESTLDDQWEHVKSELVEAIRAGDKLGERDEELMDLWHSIETYFRIRQTQGIDIHAVMTDVIKKNSERGYYGRVRDDDQLHYCPTCGQALQV
jgi:hypothetical protein